MEPEGPSRDYFECPTCRETRVERTEVTRGYYTAHARYEAEELIAFTDRCAACGTILREHRETELA